MAELSDVVANGKSTRTLAVESEDADAIIRVVRDLGLGGYTNTSYPHGLSALLDDTPERYAVIDVGTNSVKFHIGERDPDGRWRTVADRADVSRIGEGVTEQGWIDDVALERTIAAIPDHIPVILDAKIGDISHTQAAWGRGFFDEWRVDAVTVNPFVGADGVRPLLADRPDKAVYVLARTSNPSASELQGDLADGTGLSAAVLRAAQTWVPGGGGHVGFVLGATWPDELATARKLAPDANFLIPGIGAQGGELAAAVAHGADGHAGPVINAGRSILYTSAGLDFADAAREAADKLRRDINAIREQL